jgi:hypothetical protein
VKNTIRSSVPIPEKWQAFMKKEKQSILPGKELGEFNRFLSESV